MSSTTFKKVSLPIFTQITVRLLRSAGNHIETIHLICDKNQVTVFYMVVCKPLKSVCFIEDYGDFGDLQGVSFSIFIVELDQVFPPLLPRVVFL